ncbi:MAG: WD40/YVTN/BNR-like repeat-containing protein [Betaproteobacteria bacterium]
MNKTNVRFCALVISVGGLLVATLSGRPFPPGARRPAAPATAAELPRVDARFLSALEWRSIGPFRGGRVTAVAGDPDDPLVFYMGTAHGGVWKTVDAGTYWRNVSDGFFTFAPVGAIAVSPSNRDVIYVGMGESEPRQDLTPGDGVYKSTDGGQTWTHVGLEQTLHIAKIRINPTNPDIVYVAAMGDIFGTNPERGVYRTKDGGKTWQRVLFKSDRACAFDLTLDPADPNVLFASLDQFQLLPWDETSGGPDSGLYKTTDGGDTWTDITRNPGLPRGTIGKIGIAISPPRPSRVYAIIEAAEGGVYRSDDSGATWQKLFDDREQRREAASYLHITADTQDPDTVYVQHVEVWKSTDGGRTFTTRPMQHSDHHAMWIDPKNARRIIDGSDGGASITLNGGASWSTLDNQPTADLFSLAIDDRDPYWVYVAQNDNDHIALPSRTDGGAIGWPSNLDIGGGEGGQTAVKPDGSVVYACDRTTMMRYDRRTGLMRDISVWPDDQFGSAPKDVKQRFYYSFPVYLSPHDPNVLYTGSQYLFRTTDEGASWQQISPDLTRNRVDKMQKIPGGPVTSLASSLFYVSLIRTIAESPLDKNELWVGTDDSTVQVSRDFGKTWTDVSPKDFPEWTTVTAIDVSPHDPGTVYLAADRVRVSDRAPYFYKTTDYGRTWQKITDGIRPNDFAYVIREDPVRRGLLYAGTETGAYVSFDAGANWQSLQRNLPPVAVAYLQVKHDDLVAATHGRGVWIMDHVDVLRQLTPETMAAPVHLFDVQPAVRGGAGMRFGGGRASRPGVQFANAGGMVVAFEDRRGPDGTTRRTYLTAGQNPPGGALIEYYLEQAPAGEATLTFLDAAGHQIQQFSSQARDGRRMPAAAGVNRFYWDMRYPGAREASSGVALAAFEASRPMPPVAVPGRYTVRLAVGGQTYEQAFEIRKGPRIAATEADLQAQFDLMMKIRDKVSGVSDALDKLREFRRQLEGRARTGGAGATAGTLEQLRAIEGQLTRLTGSHSLELGPKGLANRLGTLSGAVGRSAARPTRQMYDVFDYLSARIDVQVSQLNQILAKGLPPPGPAGKTSETRR